MSARSGRPVGLSGLFLLQIEVQDAAQSGGVEVEFYRPSSLVAENTSDHLGAKTLAGRRADQRPVAFGPGEANQTGLVDRPGYLQLAGGQRKRPVFCRIGAELLQGRGKRQRQSWRQQDVRPADP